MIAADFPPAEAWAEFVKMRKQIKKPLTKYAETLMLKRLATFVANGEDAEAMLNQSILNCWQNVYAVKEEVQQVQRVPFPARPPQLSLVDQNHANNIEAMRLLDLPNYDDMRTINESR